MSKEEILDQHEHIEKLFNEVNSSIAYDIWTKKEIAEAFFRYGYIARNYEVQSQLSAISNKLKEREWISVDECNAPADFEDVLLLDQYGNRHIGHMEIYTGDFSDNEWCVGKTNYSIDHFTHWQPLPPPLSQKTKEIEG